MKQTKKIKILLFNTRTTQLNSLALLTDANLVHSSLPCIQYVQYIVLEICNYKEQSLIPLEVIFGEVGGII